MAYNDTFETYNFGFESTIFSKCEIVTPSESEKINKRLNGFDPSKSEVMKILNYHFSTGATHKELLSIVRIICVKTQLKLDRLATKDQRVLIKWFDENWYSIYMIIPSIHLLDNNKTPITLDREIQERFKLKS